MYRRDVLRRRGLVARISMEGLEGRELLAASSFVIHISVDGLRPDAVTSLGASQLPNFYRLRTQGAITDNARTDFDYTITLPNHTDMVTGRPVTGTGGHNWTVNTDPLAGQTIHSNKGSYVASAWDVAHDNGLRTGLWASKTKFSLYDSSYDGDTTALQGGAPDVTGEDNGRDKMDTYFHSADSGVMTDTFVSQMAANPYQYAMLHFHDADTAGHASGWMGTAYLNAVKFVDQQLGKLFNLVDGNAQLAGQTAIILTADHGGTGTTHSTNTTREHYTIPFYVWGPGVNAGADLYSINGASRLNPGTGRPTTTATPPPIRNGDVANLAMDFLGLSSVPGSFFNQSQNLAVTGAGQPAVVSIAASDAAAGEPSNEGLFTVSRTGDTSAPLTVQLGIGGSAPEGTDYAAIGTNVTIDAGSASEVFSVTPIDDMAIEGNETVIASVLSDAAYSVGSPASATVTISDDDQAPAPPSAPSSLTASSVSNNRIDLAWADNSGNEEGFWIEISTNNGKTWSLLSVVGANVSSFSATGLSANTQYAFRVKATNGVLGDSAYSNVAKARTKR